MSLQTFTEEVAIGRPTRPNFQLNVPGRSQSGVRMTRTATAGVGAGIGLPAAKFRLPAQSSKVSNKGLYLATDPKGRIVMRKALSMLGVVLLPALLIASAPQATALTITQLSNQGVGHPFPFPATACVDVGGANTADGTIIGPFPCNNQFNEQWIYKNGQFRGLGTDGCCTTAVNKCLSVHGNSKAPGAGIELDTCMSGNGSQLWFVEGSVGPVGNLSEIVNVASGFCLDSRGEIGGHLQLVIEPCNGSAGQQWDLK